MYLSGVPCQGSVWTLMLSGYTDKRETERNILGASKKELLGTQCWARRPRKCCCGILIRRWALFIRSSCRLMLWHFCQKLLNFFPSKVICSHATDCWRFTTLIQTKIWSHNGKLYLYHHEGPISSSQKCTKPLVLKIRIPKVWDGAGV